VRRGVETTILWAAGRPDRRTRSEAAEVFVACRPDLAQAIWSNVGRRYAGGRAGAERRGERALRFLGHRWILLGRAATGIDLKAWASIEPILYIDRA
jgi:hypothetical protein